MVQEHSSRLQALEEAVAQVRQDQQTAAQERHADRTRQSSEVQAVRQEVQALQAGLSQQLHTSVEALRHAQSQQEAQMNHGLSELKQLLLAQSDKRQRVDHDL